MLTDFIVQLTHMILLNDNVSPYLFPSVSNLLKLLHEFNIRSHFLLPEVPLQSLLSNTKPALLKVLHYFPLCVCFKSRTQLLYDSVQNSRYNLSYHAPISWSGGLFKEYWTPLKRRVLQPMIWPVLFNKDQWKLFTRRSQSHPRLPRGHWSIVIELRCANVIMWRLATHSYELRQNLKFVDYKLNTQMKDQCNSFFRDLNEVVKQEWS